jgi:hypothetical protein
VRKNKITCIICLIVLFCGQKTATARQSINQDNPFLINNGKCPNAIELINNPTSDGIMEALERIIPNTYTWDKKYNEWKVIQITPLPTTNPESYYSMGKHYCGEQVAKNSWFVEILFPKFLPAYDASHGQIYVAKDKEKGWFAWFRFH